MSSLRAHSLGAALAAIALAVVAVALAGRISLKRKDGEDWSNLSGISSRAGLLVGALALVFAAPFFFGLAAKKSAAGGKPAPAWRAGLQESTEGTEEFSD